jgi:hypothetical protein
MIVLDLHVQVHLYTFEIWIELDQMCVHLGIHGIVL